MAVIVHYVKHFDGGTKGSTSYPTLFDISAAINDVYNGLLDEAADEGVSVGTDISKLFTITKAEIVDGVQDYAGFRSSL